MTIFQIPDIARTQSLLICREIPHLSAKEGQVPKELDRTYGLGGWTIVFNHPIERKVCAITQYQRSGILLLILCQSTLMKSIEGKLREHAYSIAKATNKQLLAQEITLF